LNRKRLFNLLKIVVSVVLIYIILRTVDVKALWEVVRQANLWLLLAALATTMCGVILRGYRWLILVRDQGVDATLRELTALWFVSFLFSNLLPSGIGGDAIKMYELSRSSERGAQAVSSVLVDRFMGLFASQAIALVALAFAWRLLPVQVVIFTVALFGVSMLVAWIVSSRSLWDTLVRWIPPLEKLLSIKMVRALFDSLQSYSRPALVRAFLVGLGFNILLISMNILIGTALGARIPILYYLIFVPITSIVLIAPISFAGLGVREGTYVFLFSLAGMPQAVALSLSLLVYVIGTVSPGLVGGVIYLLRGTRSYQMVEDKV
jgi:glycosyltransferase 2 family protein